MVDRKVSGQLKELSQGDFIRVSWFDASDARVPLEKHLKPEILVDEWGVFLGTGGTPKHILVGKHYVRAERVWEATRIPLSLVELVELVAKHAASRASLRMYTVRTELRRLVRVRIP